MPGGRARSRSGMQTRTEVLVGLVTLAVLLGVVTLTARKGPAPTAPDLRPSTFVAGPAGAEGLLDALQRLDIATRRFRDRPTRLAALGDSAGRHARRSRPRSDPSALGAGSGRDLPLQRACRPAARRHRRQSTAPLFRLRGEAFPVRFGAVIGTGDPAPRTDAALVATHQPVVRDTSRIADFAPVTCKVPAYHSTVTLLTSSRGPVAIRLERKDNGHTVLLLADAGLLRNATLRNTAAGPFALSLFVGHDREVIFDEFHHGYGRPGRSSDAAIAWSRRVAVGMDRLAAGQRQRARAALRRGALRTGRGRYFASPPVVAGTRARARRRAVGGARPRSGHRRAGARIATPAGAAGDARRGSIGGYGCASWRRATRRRNSRLRWPRSNH